MILDSSGCSLFLTDSDCLEIFTDRFVEGILENKTLLGKGKMLLGNKTQYGAGFTMKLLLKCRKCSYQIMHLRVCVSVVLQCEHSALKKHEGHKSAFVFCFYILHLLETRYKSKKIHSGEEHEQMLCAKIPFHSKGVSQAVFCMLFTQIITSLT